MANSKSNKKKIVAKRSVLVKSLPPSVDTTSMDRVKDAIFGQGRGSGSGGMSHELRKKSVFRQLIGQYWRPYSELTTVTQKQAFVAEHIIDNLTEGGGRFWKLEANGSKKTLRHLLPANPTDEKVIQKRVQQALRDEQKRVKKLEQKEARKTAADDDSASIRTTSATSVSSHSTATSSTEDDDHKMVADDTSATFKDGDDDVSTKQDDKASTETAPTTEEAVTEKKISVPRVVAPADDDSCVSPLGMETGGISAAGTPPGYHYDAAASSYYGAWHMAWWGWMMAHSAAGQQQWQQYPHPQQPHAYPQPPMPTPTPTPTPTSQASSQPSVQELQEALRCYHCFWAHDLQIGAERQAQSWDALATHLQSVIQNSTELLQRVESNLHRVEQPDEKPHPQSTDSATVTPAPVSNEDNVMEDLVEVAPGDLVEVAPGDLVEVASNDLVEVASGDLAEVATEDLVQVLVGGDDDDDDHSLLGGFQDMDKDIVLSAQQVQSLYSSGLSTGM